MKQAGNSNENNSFHVDGSTTSGLRGDGYRKSYMADYFVLAW